MGLFESIFGEAFDGDKFLDKAEKSYQEKRYDKAENYCKECIQHNHKQLEVYELLFKVYLDTKRWKSAQDVIEKHGEYPSYMRNNWYNEAKEHLREAYLDAQDPGRVQRREQEQKDLEKYGNQIFYIDGRVVTHKRVCAKVARAKADGHPLTDDQIAELMTSYGVLHNYIPEAERKKRESEQKAEEEEKQRKRLEATERIIFEKEEETPKTTRLPKQANFNRKLGKTYFDEYSSIISQMPVMDLTLLSDEPELSNNLLFQLKFLNTHIEEMMQEAKVYEEKNRADKAADIYEKLVANGYWNTEPYHRLLVIYKMAGLRQAWTELRNHTCAYFDKQKAKLEQQILTLAQKQGCRDEIAQRIKERKRIVYYDGLFDLYNPLPELEEIRAMRF